MSGQAWAIVWAQWRTLRNYYPRNRGGLILTVFVSGLWYALWAIGAVAVASFVSEVESRAMLVRFLAPGLLLAFLYWQLIPVLMVSTGASLQMRKILVYPIPHRNLFLVDVVLRLSTALEVVLLMIGVVVGLAQNPQFALWPAIAMVPFAAFNLFLSVGVRDLITRLLAWRRMREVMVLLLILLAALPQIVFRSGEPGQAREFFLQAPLPGSPWAATASLVAGDWSALHLLTLSAWLGLAYAFGRWQFERGLRFDEEAARATPLGPVPAAATAAAPWSDRLFRLPQRVLPDPLAALVEKELRTLIRSPRFRIVFLMGFSFGLLIWLPMAFGRRQGVMAEHFLVIVAGYAIMLLSEVCIWNVFGFDRSASQFYWLAPLSTVWALVAKNIAAAIFVVAEILIISLVCGLFRLPVTPALIAECLVVSLVFLCLLMAIGNWSSLKYARPVDPNQNWKRNAAGRFQMMLVVVYPLLAAPFLFAYFARQVWEAEWAFYGVIAFTGILAAIAYGFSLEHASVYASKHRERVLSLLGQGDSPVL